MAILTLDTLSLVELSSEVESRFVYWMEHKDSTEAYERYQEAQRHLISRIRRLGLNQRF